MSDSDRVPLGNRIVRPDSSRITSGAESFYQRIHRQIEAFEQKLAPGESLRLSHQSATGPCVIERVGYYGEDMMVFGGLDGQKRSVGLLVSVHAVNLTLTVVPGGPEKRRPIGFIGEVAGGDQPQSSGEAAGEG